MSNSEHGKYRGDCPCPALQVLTVQVRAGNIRPAGRTRPEKSLVWLCQGSRRRGSKFSDSRSCLQSNVNLP